MAKGTFLPRERCGLHRFGGTRSTLRGAHLLGPHGATHFPDDADLSHDHFGSPDGGSRRGAAISSPHILTSGISLLVSALHRQAADWLWHLLGRTLCHAFLTTCERRHEERKYALP